jgi:hypothetical protein
MRQGEKILGRGACRVSWLLRRILSLGQLGFEEQLALSRAMEIVGLSFAFDCFHPFRPTIPITLMELFALRLWRENARPACEPASGIASGRGDMYTWTDKGSAENPSHRHAARQQARRKEQTTSSPHNQHQYQHQHQHQHQHQSRAPDYDRTSTTTDGLASERRRVTLCEVVDA